MATEQEQSAVRSCGKVSWFSNTKGYGFITPDGDGEELFVHQSSVVSDGFRSLSEGESVEFTVAQGNDGKTKAVDVTAPGGAPLNKKDFGSRGNAGRRGGSGRGCFNCGEVGHMARDCDTDGERNNNRGGEGCYNCGESGHFARECRQNAGGRSGGGVGGTCYNCGGFGHMARNCASGRSNERRRSGGDSKCFNCGEQGHFARDCPAVAAA